VFNRRENRSSQGFNPQTVRFIGLAAYSNPEVIVSLLKMNRLLGEKDFLADPIPISGCFSGGLRFVYILAMATSGSVLPDWGELPVEQELQDT